MSKMRANVRVSACKKSPSPKLWIWNEVSLSKTHSGYLTPLLLSLVFWFHKEISDYALIIYSLSHPLSLSLSLSHTLTLSVWTSHSFSYCYLFCLFCPSFSFYLSFLSFCFCFFIFLSHSHSLSFYLSFSLPLYRSLPIIHLHSPSVFFHSFFRLFLNFSVSLSFSLLSLCRFLSFHLSFIIAIPLPSLSLVFALIQFFSVFI